MLLRFKIKASLCYKIFIVEFVDNKLFVIVTLVNYITRIEKINNQISQKAGNSQ